MHARITTVTAGTDIDRAIAFLRDQAVPQLQQQRGYRGLSASADRTSGGVSILTLWDTRADLDASESTADKARRDTMAILGGQAEVERYEQVVSEVGPVPPGPGSKLQVRRFKMSPDRMEDNLANFRSVVLPDLRSAAGFQGARQLINRDTGEGATGTVWADDTALQKADAMTQPHRQQAMQRGVEFGEVQLREILLADVR